MSRASPFRAYELWYEYLLETDPVTWSDEVRKDFRGVLTAGSFKEWFNADARFPLFGRYGMKKENLPVRTLHGKQDQEWVANWIDRFDGLDDEADDPSRHTVLIINLDYPRDFLMKRVELLLKMAQPEKRPGRPNWKASYSKYPFHRRPDISSLEIALAAFRLKKNGLSNWQVGQELAKSFPILQAQKIKGKDDPNKTAKQKVLESAVSRYLKMADVVMAGVVRGVFPAR